MVRLRRTGRERLISTFVKNLMCFLEGRILSKSIKTNYLRVAHNQVMHSCIIEFVIVTFTPRSSSSFPGVGDILRGGLRSNRSVVLLHYFASTIYYCIYY